MNQDNVVAETDENARHLHLLGATGMARLEQYDGRDHYVVPCVALMEGVIHAINSPVNEFVPTDTLVKAAKSWEGKPVVWGHPTDGNGRQISANSPDVLAAHGIGTIRNSRVVGSKLLMDAYMDPVNVERIGGLEFLEQIKNGADHGEISVGAFVMTEDTAGNYGEKPYKAIWRDTAGDHLAWLPRGRGACSVEMGCGAHRSAMRHLMSGDSIEIQEPEPVVTVLDEMATALQNLEVLARKLRDCPACNGSGNTGGNPCEACDGKGELKVAAGARHSSSDRKVIQDVHDLALKLGAECASKSEPAIETLAAEDTTVADTKIHVSEKKDEIRAALAAEQLCGCGGKQMGMTPEQKAVEIAALVEHKHSGFTASDAKMLEAASDERIEAFKVAAAAREKEVLKTAAKFSIGDTVKTSDGVGTVKSSTNGHCVVADKEGKVMGSYAEGELKAAAAPMTSEEIVAALPVEYRTMIERQRAQDTAHKADLVTALKTAQEEFSESELAAMPITDLERLSRACKIAQVEEVSYAGRGVPVNRSAADAANVFANPPDPYEAGLKALRGETVN